MVGLDLSSVLHGLSKLYSPIKHQNACISIHEDGAWMLKGHFSNALNMVEDVPWVRDDWGKWSVKLQAEISGSALAGDGSLLPSALPASVPTPTSGALQKQLKSLLNIPESLTTWGRSNDLHLAYAKYKGVLKAWSDMQRMKIDGTWTLGKVSTDALIELFVSKTVWYTYYIKLFPQVARWTHLAQWMENDPDARASMK